MIHVFVISVLLSYVQRMLLSCGDKKNYAKTKLQILFGLKVIVFFSVKHVLYLYYCILYITFKVIPVVYNLA